MYNFDFRPETYFLTESTSVLLVKLTFPESQWGEQISIYAHFLDRKIEYEALDFYGNDFMLYPRVSEEPLTFEDMVYQIETITVNTDQIEGKPELTLNGIPEAESIYYPELKNYFEEKRKNFDLL